MKRILIITNTYYQLIMSVQMALTLYCDDEVVLLITDRSNGAKEVYERLNSLSVFSEVHYVEVKELKNQRQFHDKMKDLFDLSFGNTNRFSLYLKEVNNLFFDYLLFYNPEADIYGVYSILYKHNREIKSGMFEEGVLSYGVSLQQNTWARYIKTLRKMARKKDLSDAVECFYCFYPEIYKGTLKPIKIDNIEQKGKCAGVLRNVFDLDSVSLSYSAKYIYFTSVFDFEQGDAIGEYDLVCRIADLVGRENLIVKIHPRDSRSIYYDNGFNVDSNSRVPWEAIQLSTDFAGKVFLTATSGSVLAGTFMAKDKVTTFFLYRLCNTTKNNGAKKSIASIESLLNNENLAKILEKVSIANTIEDVL